MDHHALEYYRAYSEAASNSHFHHVIALHENPVLDWSKSSKLSPQLCRGWFELAHLSAQDRLEFTREFWLTKLPYQPDLTQFLTQFFASLDDIAIFLTQQKYDDVYEAHMVYSLANNGGFFHGRCPATEIDINNLQKEFPDYILPPDYLAFLQIHNGFAKLTDTGIAQSANMKENYEFFQQMVEEQGPIHMAKRDIDPRSLIPFYKSFDMPFFQCFWSEWHPGQEMGNVYYSGVTHTISDWTKKDARVEAMAFQTFTDWLTFYLEKID